MFYDKPGCTKLADGIYVFKNYLNKDKVKEIEDITKTFIPKEHLYEESLIDWYTEKVSKPIPELNKIWEDVSELLSPELVIHPSMNLLVTVPGDNGMFCHSDSPGRDMEEDLSQLDVFNTCCIIDYGLVAYFGDFTGGEVYYPEFNRDGTFKGDGPVNMDDCLEYQPESGDVVIHGSTDKWKHGVREITSGTRYAYSNFVLRSDENPGTFYNYGTSEYYNQVGDKSLNKLIQWMKPLKENEYLEVIKARVAKNKNEGEN
ncbi:hypothetical protein UFOVP1491_144 [uncultured Caudovirales phage]|uniref:Fe2OG dioxygenase domain-containing protein n=1 Tax=uncultured Caudovirales phage TaxID=2100421 RepID=A0A6J7XKI0_9CAUD|nr:hypothetical protein UFOVP485_129 [uncultured Caudovirales phage]CAB4150977.1 hypothetical protein UFOVP575_81 [uncultured Caudovirales phage]CAB4174757.1 hypothetical protein UFOVP963_79 [uncultured Caudovirales phage]CAB4179878.1 hypothetical protein UFOVP1032_144 [uncultured Caudovirales phage]CAB4185542.1 hypothetical protein UFOVP1125_60 [uncultured Caudovirales phage]